MANPLRAQSAFLSMPTDPFSEYHRLEREWDARFDRLSRDAAMLSKQAEKSCQRNTRETSRG